VGQFGGVHDGLLPTKLQGGCVFKSNWIVRTVLAAAMFAMSHPAHGDVTIKRHATMDGMGGLLKSSITSTESYSGDMMANDSETKMENKLLKMFGGGKPIHTTHITRLDKELMWNIEHKDKKYTEMTFAEMRAMMDSLGTLMAGGTDPMAQQQPAFDTSEVTFSEPEFTVKRTGKTESIAGHNCEQAIMTMVSKGVNRETGDTMVLDLTMDMMLAKNVPGADEATAFSVRMAQAMGFEMDGGAGQSMAKMLGMYGIDAEKVAEEAKKLEGFAMQTVMSFTIGGDAMAQAQADQEKAKDEEASEEEAAKSEEESPSDASGMAAKALGGLFGGKKDKKDKEEAEPASGAPPGAMLWMTTTVTGIESGAVPAASFEIPEGYKLKKSE
jgi:hypothetical protein